MSKYPLSMQEIRWAVHKFFDKPNEDHAWRDFDQWFAQEKQKAFAKGYEKGLHDAKAMKGSV